MQTDPATQPAAEQQDSKTPPQAYPGFAVSSIALVCLSCFVISSFFIEDVLVYLGLPNRTAFFMGGLLCSGLFFLGLPCVCLRLMHLSPLRFAGNFPVQRPSQVLLWLGLGVCCRLVILPLQLGWAALLHLLGLDSVSGTAVLYSSSFLLNALCFAILPGVFEEFFFRGVLFRNLQGYSRLVPAVLLSSGIFALLHMDLLNIFPVLVVGAVCALSLHYSGNVLSAMLIHVVFNLTGILMSTYSAPLFSLFSGVNTVVLLTASAYVIPLLGILGFIGCFFSFRALRKTAHQRQIPSFSCLYDSTQKKACMVNTIVMLCCVGALFLAAVVGSLI